MDDLDLWLGQIDECGINIRFLFATINAYYTIIARQLENKLKKFPNKKKQPYKLLVTKKGDI
jgi:hypothetical protein